MRGTPVMPHTRLLTLLGLPALPAAPPPDALPPLAAACLAGALAAPALRVGDPCRCCDCCWWWFAALAVLLPAGCFSGLPSTNLQQQQQQQQQHSVITVSAASQVYMQRAVSGANSRTGREMGKLHAVTPLLIHACVCAHGWCCAF
jgi:hypothetical protein